MKLLLVNSVFGIRSTGRILVDIISEYEKKGWECKAAYGRCDVPDKYKKYAIKIGNKFSLFLNAFICRFFDNDGFFAKRQTRRFIKWANEYNPDIIWLHNLHGYYINVPLLFEWIKTKKNVQVFWTFHDCWPFTGHCCHFDSVKCMKWREGCHHCPEKKSYPKSLFFDLSKRHFLIKKEVLSDLQNIKIITPSIWLSKLVKQSFLSRYKVVVKNNVIDYEVFKPTKSLFREKHHLENKTIVLGVASSWSKKKGLDDFLSISKMLDQTFQIVLVGLSKKQIKKIPKGIICIERTNNVTELAGIYTTADVFLNLTYEDNYPTVNLEAQACGTACITYNTGGSPESVSKENVVNQGDLKKVIERIYSITKFRGQNDD